MAEFLMPSLGSDMEAGTLIEWQKQPGDTVTRGDIIAVVETQKGAIEIEVFDSGVLETQLVDIGKQVPVGTPLAFIRTHESADPVQRTATPVAAHEAVAGRDTKSHPEVDSINVRSPATSPHASEDERQNHRIRISPAARKLAGELGIDTTRLSGSGPGGAIVLEDIRAKSASGKSASKLSVVTGSPARTSSAATVGQAEIPADTSTASADMRRAIAAAMARSKREIPHYYLSHTIDISSAEQWLVDANADRDPSSRILLGALLLKAVSLALQKYPEFNGHFRDGEFQPSSRVHAGMAINLRGGGLVAPAIHNTHELDVDNIMLRLRDLIERVRQGRFRASELADPTITLSSLGERGVFSLYGVIYPPQVAIVGFGTPSLRPWVTEHDELQARRLVEVTLAADHRVSDGHRGALFLRQVQKKLEKPGELCK